MNNQNENMSLLKRQLLFFSDSVYSSFKEFLNLSDPTIKIEDFENNILNFKEFKVKNFNIQYHFLGNYIKDVCQKYNNLINIFIKYDSNLDKQNLFLLFEDNSVLILNLDSFSDVVYANFKNNNFNHYNFLNDEIPHKEVLIYTLKKVPIFKLKYLFYEK